MRTSTNTRMPSDDFITIEVHNGGTSCDLQLTPFTAGERYLISGTAIDSKSKPQPRRFYNNFCGLRVRLDS